MKMFSRQRFYAGLLFLGGGFLLYRTIYLITHGSFEINVLWVNFLIIIEMILDICVMIFCLKWWIANNASYDSIPLRLAAAVTIFHALRVLVFAIGRIGPWINFDVRPEHRALHYTRWSIEGVYFASIMSVLGIIGVIVIWRLRKKQKSKMPNNTT